MVCKANVPHQTDLKVQVKTNERFCASGSDDQCAGEALLHDLEGGDLDLLHVPADLRPLLDLLSTALCGGSSTFVETRPHCLHNHATYSCYRGQHIQLRDSLDRVAPTLPPIGQDDNKQADVASSKRTNNGNDSEENDLNKTEKEAGKSQWSQSGRKTVKEDTPSKENELTPKESQRDSVDSVKPLSTKRQYRKLQKNKKYGPPWSENQVFTGYCKCRNLGNIRMCYRCKSPFL